MTAPEVPVTQADRASLEWRLDCLIDAASRQWGSGSPKHNLVRDVADVVARYRAASEALHLARIAALEAENARLREAAEVECGLGPHATVLDDGDGFLPVAVLRGGNAYIQQGDATIIISLDMADRLCAALTVPQRTEAA